MNQFQSNYIQAKDVYELSVKLVKDELLRDRKYMEALKQYSDESADIDELGGEIERIETETNAKLERWEKFDRMKEAESRMIDAFLGVLSGREGFRPQLDGLWEVTNIKAIKRHKVLRNKILDMAITSNW